jgi:hypothetical protein
MRKINNEQCRKLELNQYLNLTRNSFYLLNYFGYIINNLKLYDAIIIIFLYLGKESNLRLYIFRIVLLPISYQGYNMNNK